MSRPLLISDCDDVLLHFARWMADHERPYLDRPELLEFPTETWAAQDIRKSEIFDLAARHASGEDVARFTERDIPRSSA